MWCELEDISIVYLTIKNNESGDLFVVVVVRMERVSYEAVC